MEYKKGQLDFWTSHCPYQTIVRFCTLSGKYELSKCEFGLRWGDTAFMRNLKFKDVDEARAFLERMGRDPEQLDDDDVDIEMPLQFADAGHMQDYCIERLPDSISRGPIFPGVHRSTERKSLCLQKPTPIVFDVDIDDFLKAGYERYCKCLARSMCDKCWVHLMRPAMRYLDTYLQNHGFKAVLFVYSGRRGFNCFVLDARVWTWTKDQRKGLMARVDKHFLRLDLGASVDPVHLIKCPLVPHPVTKRIACPIMNLETFCPDSDYMTIWKINKQLLNEWAKFVDHKLDLALCC